MNNNCLPNNKRKCPHCKVDDSLSYYHEVGQLIDLYYCKQCFRVIEWNGKTIRKIDGEAYPNREKVTTSKTV